MHTTTTTHRTLRNSIIRALAIAALVTVSLGTLAACSDAAETQSEATGNADITSNWRFYSVTGDGETTYRFPTDRDEDLPFFVSNGTDFEISTVPGTVRRGAVAVNEDGTYTLTMAENGNEFQAVIEGNMLTIYFTGDRELAFEAVN